MYLGKDGCPSKVKSTGENCTISTTIPNDGVYTLHLYKSKGVTPSDGSTEPEVSDSSLLLAKKYELVYSGLKFT